MIDYYTTHSGHGQCAGLGRQDQRIKELFPVRSLGLRGMKRKTTYLKVKADNES